MKDLIILGIPILIIVALQIFSYEKKLKTNSYLLIVSVLVTIGYGGYLIGSADDFSFARIFLILVFFIGGFWRLIQFTRINKPS